MDEGGPPCAKAEFHVVSSVKKYSSSLGSPTPPPTVSGNKNSILSSLTDHTEQEAG